MSPVIGSLREPGNDEPVKLERVEVRPGVVLKLSPADKAAIEKHEAEAAKNRAAWEKAVIGEAPEAEPEPGPEPETAEPDVEEAAVVAAPKPTRSRKK